jgi:hypothetical protein
LIKTANAPATPLFGTPNTPQTPIEYDEIFAKAFMACDTNKDPDSMVELFSRPAL